MRVAGVLAGIGLVAAVTACRQATPPAEDPLAAIEVQRDQCGDEAAGDPVMLQNCDAVVIEAAAALIPKARNGAFQDMLPAMFEPLLFARTGGEDALADRVVVAASYARLALARARVLTGGPEPRTAAAAPPSFAMFGEQADDLAKVWSAVRSGDCQAHPVPDCAARLDAAMSGMLHEHAAP